MLDDVENLILLCRVHHKVVDDQISKYSVAALQGLKADHERWVDESLSNKQRTPKIVRNKSAIPEILNRVMSGQLLMNAACSCMATFQRVPEDLDEELVSRIGGFLENLQDYRDIWEHFGIAEQLKAYASLTEELRALESLGLGVFQGTENAQLEGGMGPSSAWKILHIAVCRFSELEIPDQQASS